MGPQSPGVNVGALSVTTMAVTTLFFAWGFITQTIDPLIASVRAIFSLSYTEALLTQFAYFMAYGVVSLPGAALVNRVGMARRIVIALVTMIVGCLVIPLATHLGTYELRAGGAVHHRERGDGAAGGGESAGFGAGAAGEVALPAAAVTDVQFAGHGHRAVLRLRDHAERRHLRCRE